MTIWGSFVFAKPLGRAARRLKEALPAEHLPAMNHLIQTLSEYLQATDPKAHDVYEKAVGHIAGLAPAPSLPGRLSDKDIDDLIGETCKPELGDSSEDLFRLARAIEARVRLTCVTLGD